MKKRFISLITLSLVFCLALCLFSCEQAATDQNDASQDKGSDNVKKDTSVTHTVSAEQWKDIFTYDQDNAGKISNGKITLSGQYESGSSFSRTTSINGNLLVREDEGQRYYLSIENGKRYAYEQVNGTYVKSFSYDTDNFWLGMSDDFASAYSVLVDAYSLAEYNTQANAYIFENDALPEADVASMNGTVVFENGSLISADVVCTSTSKDKITIKVSYGNVEKITLPSYVEQ